MKKENINTKKGLRIYQDDFIKKYQSGMTIQAIADEYAISKTIVRKYLKEKIDLRQKNITIKHKGTIYKDYMTGMSLNSIAKKYKTTGDTIKRMLIKEFDIKFKTNRKYQELSETFKEEYLSGKSVEEISKKYSVSRMTVLNYINEDGVKSRNYVESRRDSKIVDNYFNSLDYKKAYVLGQVFAFGHIIKTSTSTALELSGKPSERDIIINIAQNFSNKDISTLYHNKNWNSYLLRISSIPLTENLKSFGLDKASKSFINNELLNKLGYINKFYEGLFSETISFSKRVINFNNLPYKEYIYDYLTNYLKIKNVRINNSVYLENKDDILILFEKLPTLKKLFLEQYNDKLKNTSWTRVYNLITS